MSVDDPSPETRDAIVGQLETFLEEFPGTQRELLVALEAGWISRLLKSGATECAMAAAMIRRKIKSKKLVSERETLVERLFA